MDALSNATYCNNAAGAAIAFTSPTTGGTVTFNWTSSVDVGFGLSGTGDIPAYTAANATNSPVTATVSVTATLNGCTGTATTFTVTVNPTPSVDALSNATYCNNAAGAAITFTSPTTGGTVTFNWTSSVDVGFGLSGTGDIPAYTAANATNSPVTATVSVTATLNGCTGTATTFTVTVNPTPSVDALSSATYCNSASASAITFSSPTTGTAIFNWTSTADVGFGVSGTGNIGAYTATNATNSPVTATVSVTATINGCTGTSTTFTVTVNPTPVVAPVSNATWCNNTAASAITFSSPTNRRNGNVQLDKHSQCRLWYEWHRNRGAYTATNATNSQGNSVTVSVIATVNGCTGAATTFTVTVNPTPSWHQSAMQRVVIMHQHQLSPSAVLHREQQHSTGLAQPM